MPERERQAPFELPNVLLTPVHPPTTPSTAAAKEAQSRRWSDSDRRPFRVSEYTRRRRPAPPPPRQHPRPREPIQRRVDGPFGEVECAGAPGAELTDDPVPVGRPRRQRREEQEIEMTFQYLGSPRVAILGR